MTRLRLMLLAAALAAAPGGVAFAQNTSPLGSSPAVTIIRPAPTKTAPPVAETQAPSAASAQPQMPPTARRGGPDAGAGPDAGGGANADAGSGPDAGGGAR